MTERTDVAFKTVDGLTLRGWLFKGLEGGPAVIVNGAVSQSTDDSVCLLIAISSMPRKKFLLPQ